MFAAQDGVTPNDKLYSDSVFSTYLYTGNGSTQTINNGIDLAGKGGMVWLKCRNDTFIPKLFDTDRGAGNRLRTDTTAGNSYAANDLTSFTSSGFALGAEDSVNFNARTYVSWTFRKSARFFDVVTYTGNGVAGRQVAHSLGVAPGMIITKKTNSTSSWNVYHKGIGATKVLLLNATNAEFAANTAWSNTEPTTSVFTVGVDNGCNADGDSYVAYLFAHDTSADGIIQCGSFTTDGSGNATVNHGWSAGVQFALIKCSSTTGDWEMFDTARTSGWSGSDARLRANLSNAEDSVTRLSASGTSVSFAGLSNSATYIYMLIVSPT